MTHTKDLLRDLMLNHTTASGFGCHGASRFSMEWRPTEWRKGWTLHIEVLSQLQVLPGVQFDRVALCGESFGITVCALHELPTVLELVERFLPTGCTD